MSSKECKKFISEFASRISDEHKLRDLAITLDVGEPKVKKALIDNRRDGNGVSGAAATVLDIWKEIKGKRSDQEYLDELEAACDENSGLKFDFHDVYGDIYKKPFVRTQEKQNIPQASGSDDVDASTRKTTGGERKRVDEEEDSGEEESEDLTSHDETGFSIHAARPPDDGRSLEALLKKPAPQLGFYDFRKNVGKAVIISNDFRDDKKKFLKGYQKDVETIKGVVEDIGLQCDPPHENKSTTEILNILKNKAKEDYKEYSCVCCFFLSHGNADGIETADGQVTIRELTDCFNQLKGMPKLFFIQACRGSEREETSMAAGGPTDKEEIISKEADIFEFYAAPLSYVSWVHPTHGSTFMQCLCHVLKDARECNRLRYADIHEIATNTNNMISKVICEAYKEQTEEEKKKYTPQERGKYLQVSVANSTLTKNFRFMR